VVDLSLPLLLNCSQPANGYDSDHLDESEEERPAPKKRKLTKAAEAKLKAKEKAKKKNKDDEGDYDDDDDEEEDMYTALSKSMYKSTRPPIGSFEDCAKCGKQFTVARQLLPCPNPPTQFLL
jgi:DNA repair protein RAD7